MVRVVLLKQDILTHNFSEGQLLRIDLTLCKSISEPEEKLAVDGPNVNWTLLYLLDDKLVSDNFSKTLNIGSCAQLSVHDSLKHGFQKSTWNMDKLLKSIFWILHDSPARRDVYLQEGSTDKFPSRLVSLRYRLRFKFLASTIVLTYIKCQLKLL